MPNMHNDQVSLPTINDNATKPALIDMSNAADVRPALGCGNRIGLKETDAIADKEDGFLRFDNPYAKCHKPTENNKPQENNAHRPPHGDGHSNGHGPDLNLDDMSLDQLKQLADRIREAIKRELAECEHKPQPEIPKPQPEIPKPNPEVPKPEVPKPNPEVPKPEVPKPNPEVPKPEIPKPNPENPKPEPEVPKPNPEVPKPEPSKTAPKLIDIFPTSDRDWTLMNSRAPKDSIIVALPSKDVSWDTDVPFDSISQELQDHLSDSVKAGMKPLGYVGTLGGTKDINIVKAEIDSWYKASHGNIRGIYLGDSGNHLPGGGYATDAKSEAYFKEIARYIHEKGGFAAINGGGTPNPDLINDFDMHGTYEYYADKYQASGKDAKDFDHLPADHFAAELIGVTEDNIDEYAKMLVDNHIGYIALTEDWRAHATDKDSYFNKVLDVIDGF